MPITSILKTPRPDIIKRFFLWTSSTDRMAFKAYHDWQVNTVDKEQSMQTNGSS